MSQFSPFLKSVLIFAFLVFPLQSFSESDDAGGAGCNIDEYSKCSEFLSENEIVVSYAGDKANEKWGISCNKEVKERESGSAERSEIHSCKVLDCLNMMSGCKNQSATVSSKTTLNSSAEVEKKYGGFSHDEMAEIFKKPSSELTPEEKKAKEDWLYDHTSAAAGGNKSDASARSDYGEIQKSEKEKTEARVNLNVTRKEYERLAGPSGAGCLRQVNKAVCERLEGLIKKYQVVYDKYYSDNLNATIQYTNQYFPAAQRTPTASATSSTSAGGSACQTTRETCRATHPLGSAGDRGVGDALYRSCVVESGCPLR